MPIKYYTQQRADSSFWSEHWGQYDIASLLQWVESSPLTHLLAHYLPSKGKILEAGCGLGQFVLYFRSKGYEIEGIDFSETAIRICKEFDPSAPVRVGDVRHINVPDGTYQAYISLGVVEHFEEGPDEVLQEARRVLSRDGLLILSVPFINGLRLLFKPIIQYLEERKQRKYQYTFYQYAYSKREIINFLRRNGFEPIAFHPYDPGRLIRRFFRFVLIIHSYKSKQMRHSKDRVDCSSNSLNRGSKVRCFLQKMLYFPPILWAFAHMILVVAKVSTDA